MWAKIDDAWWSHPKVVSLSNAACGTWAKALSWSCHQRSNHVPTGLLSILNGTDDEANELVSSGLWIAADGGWIIHDWAEYQDKSLREIRSEAGQRGGVASGEARREASERRSKKEANPEAGTRPVPSRPEKTPRVLDAEQQFEVELWPVYPKRDGRKLEKPAALKAFIRFSKADRAKIVQAARNYAAACNAPNGVRARDCVRFLRDDFWRDWLEASEVERGYTVVHGVQRA